MSNFAPAAEWAVRVIEIISASDEPLGITDISRSAGINKNMVFRVLNSLEAAGWVYCENPNEKKYHLTLRPFQMTRKAVDRLSINTVATPFIHALWQRLGESTYLGILKDDKVMYIQHFDSTKDLKVAGALGGMYDLYCSAPGKILLAYSDEKYIEEYIHREHPRRTDKTLTTPEELRDELGIIRKNGYAIDNEEFSCGILCVAAPVFDGCNKVIGTIGCSFPTVNRTMGTILDECGKDIVSTAKEISKCCGMRCE